MRKADKECKGSARGSHRKVTLNLIRGVEFVLCALFSYLPCLSLNVLHSSNDIEASFCPIDQNQKGLCTRTLLENVTGFDYLAVGTLDTA